MLARRLALLVLLACAAGVAVGAGATRGPAPNAPGGVPRGAVPATQPSTRPAEPRRVLAKIIDSTGNPGRPPRLHPSTQMVRGQTPGGLQLKNPIDFTRVADAAVRQDLILTLDLEVLPGDAGYPTGLEPDDVLAARVARRLEFVREFRRRLPDRPIGVYAFLPAISFYAPMRRAAFLDPKAPAWAKDLANPETRAYADAWEKWKQGNDRIAALALADLDFLCPQLYCFNDNKQDWDWLLQGTITEARRVAKGRQVYAFVSPYWWDVDKNPRGADPAPYEFFRHVLETSLKQADGVVIWGGWQHKYDGRAGWVRALREVLDGLDAAAPRRPAGGG